MTGYTVHTGSTEKFSEGWDNIFGDRKASKKKAPAKLPKKKSKKSPSRKKTTAKRKKKSKDA